MYPLSGHVGEVSSPMQAAVLLSERMDYKLHREGLVWDSNAIEPCHEYLNATMPKSRYRYQLTNTIADASHCYPFGHTTLDWEAFNLNPAEANHFGFLIWRKRNCVYL
jgi:conjugal transfer pilus assembly protein TraU